MSDPAAAPPPHLRPPPVTARRVIGIIIMVIGIAMTVISGLCTAGFMVDDFSSGGGGGEINLSGIEFVIGGPFILIGGLMWWGGARLKRLPPSPPDPSIFGEPPSAPPATG